VGDDDARHAQLFTHTDHELIDDGARDGIQSGRRLVVEDVLGLARDRSRDSDALAHSAGQLGGKLFLYARKVDEIEGFGDASHDLALAHLPFLAQPHRDVLADVEGVEERGELEDVADVGP
jgi:hypothetical protein